MALSHVSWRICNTLFPFSDFVYILQLEEYSSQRFVKWLPRFFLRRNFQIRQQVAWTSRAIITCTAAILLWLVCTATTWMFVGAFSLICIVLIPIFVLAANVLLHLPFEFIHARMRRRATKRILVFKQHGKIVVVAGSYGKTTTKVFLEQLVRYHFRVQATPGNTNTPSGIATWILRHIKPGTNLLIIEADGYSKREYQEIGTLVGGDIVIITNVGDQHLERFGSRARLAEALSEVIARSDPHARVIISEATRSIVPEQALRDRALHIVESSSEKLLSTSNAINLGFAREVAKILKVPDAIITDTADKLELPDRRQKPTHMYGYEAIDDSYNISWTTAQAGIATAKKAAHKAGKKLLVITAGIMELNAENKDKNIRLGELLSREADHTVVLGSMFASEVVQGLANTSCTVVPSLATFLREAHARFDPREWLLLVQPEMHDLYY